MIEIKAKPMKWGNSIGLRLSKTDAKRARIKLGKEVNLLIQENKKTNLSKIFGSLKDWKKPTDQIMKEIDEGW
ncbi:MAG: hypothetical protein AABW56_00995 [Nanoarchaeota archaeon]